MRTREERLRELNEWATTNEGQQKIVDAWKQHHNEDPGHWRPAGGWDYPALIQDILEREYHKTGASRR